MGLALKPRLTEIYTGARLRSARRFWQSMLRGLRGQRRRVLYFHQVDDPYSHLLLQVLPQLLDRYSVELVVHLVGPPEASSTPDRERLQVWSRSDAAKLATETGLLFGPADQPKSAAVDAANAGLCAIGVGREWGKDELAQALAIGLALWDECWLSSDGAIGSDAGSVAVSLSEGAKLRRKLGHYLSAMLYFEGEWYWGVDRLAHLEQRLQGAGRASNSPAPIVSLPPPSMPETCSKTGAELHFYCSLRSPYSYLAVRRCLDLAEHYGAQLCIRFVLPMVMRGLPVPKSKRLYIVRDAKREAERLGLPFGRIADPLGTPTERGLAVLSHAIQVGKGAQFLDAFTRAVWSEGVDAGSDRGLLTIAKRVDLDKSFVRLALADQQWLTIAQSNRDEMLSLGLWGVPSFRVNRLPACWGQDRIWRVEKDLLSLANN